MTCEFTIGWITRWPIAPTGPAIETSAAHFIAVPPSASASSNCVSIESSAPTPLPFAASLAYSGGRSSILSKAIDIFSEPSPSGTATFALQWRSSWTSNDSTFGIVCAICAGSFSTLPDDIARRGERRGALDLHCASTETFSRVDAGSLSISQTRQYGLHES